MQVLSEKKGIFFFLYVCNEGYNSTYNFFLRYVAIDVTKLYLVLTDYILNIKVVWLYFSFKNDNIKLYFLCNK